jgi:phosphoglycolate phosphatase
MKYKQREINLNHKAVLFDLDGTLLDTLQDLAEAVNQGLSAIGLPVHEIAAYRYFLGEGREEMVTKALPPANRDPATIKQVVALVNQYYGLHWRDHTRPYPGVSQLLDSLTEKSVWLTVFSNKPQEFTTLSVDGLLSEWHFDKVLGASPTVPKKPDCSAAIRIASELGLRTSDFLYLGDSGIDMQTAINAGMYPVGALWGFRTREELLEKGAKAVIDKPQDLLRLL